MFSDSEIPRDTIQVYLETHYHVSGDTPTLPQVDRFNPTLASLHEARQVTGSVFITACNPFSQNLCSDANAARQATLAHELEQLGLEFVEGIGLHLSNNWPGEASYLVLGTTLDTAKALSEKHGQRDHLVWRRRRASTDSLALIHHRWPMSVKPVPWPTTVFHFFCALFLGRSQGIGRIPYLSLVYGPNPNLKFRGYKNSTDRSVPVRFAPDFFTPSPKA